MIMPLDVRLAWIWDRRRVSRFAGDCAPPYPDSQIRIIRAETDEPGDLERDESTKSQADGNGIAHAQ
jgi:hypothetical protein